MALMNALRVLAAVTLMTGLTACGGSRRTIASRLPPPPSAPVQQPASLAVVLPASAAGPTTCTVYEPGLATQVVFDSQSLNVTGECQAWSSHEPGAGYLWAYQPTGAVIGTTAVPVCGLRDPSGRVTATVVANNGSTPLSSAERRAISSACASLASAGWRGHGRGAGERRTPIG